ncbi:MAG: serine/threonine-protein kinase [Acidobacteria bacterium]|nr:serine/threonine-protein kinase [Acidobacteriota bacterium]
MALAIGTRIGPYEITGTLGVGGMGEVYRARDPRLARDVALKVLPDLLADNPEQLARFEREAQVLAALKHPNIGAIYGLEESSGVRALVLELVEGETLADRIARGAIPVDEALPIARQIADALEAAHERGIVHRDLKPSNIKVQSDGLVKVLDFGLAKLTQAPGSGAQSQDLTGSPTVTSPAPITGAGMILGTVAYLSPEQAKGHPADKRCDIWAFGCVLYEMLTGCFAFRGDGASETLAFILTREPDWSRLPAATPPQVRRLLQRALEKDRKRRLADAGDARLEIDEAIAAASTRSISLAGTARDAAFREQDPSYVRRVWRRRTVLMSAAALVTGGVAVGTAVWLTTRPEPPRVTRLTITPTPDAALTVSANGRSVAVTPDGTRVVYTSGSQLFVRALDELEPVALSGVAAPVHPFVSPDGAWVGFFDNLALHKVAITGGPPIMLCRQDGPAARGATWGPDGTIVFANNQAATGLQRVSADGGEITVLTRPNRERGEADHVWPESLPGGEAILFTIESASGGPDAFEIAVLDLRTGTQRVVVQGGSHARYVSSGHLVYLAGGSLRAVPFDLQRLEVVGTPVPVLPQVRVPAVAAADLDVATDGTLVYVAGGTERPALSTLVWVDRQGRETAIPVPPGDYQSLELSPDGRRVVLGGGAQRSGDISIWDLDRDLLTRLTFDPALDWRPMWMADGRRIAFASNRAGALNIFVQPADGTGSAERLTEAPHDQLPTSATRDGTRLIMYENRDSLDLSVLALDGTRSVRPLIATRANENSGRISPDERWLAYASNESGRTEVYVRPFPDVDAGRWQVSTGGGAVPAWSRAGDELFYQQGRSLVGVRVEKGETWTARPPVSLFEGPYVFASGGNAGYDVAPDGRRFLMIKPADTAAPPGPPPTLVVVQHWLEDLRRRVPVP